MADSKSGSTTNGKSGSGSSDTLQGGRGGLLTGTSGIDTVPYNMPYSSVKVSHSSSGSKGSSGNWSVEFSANGSSGTDTLTDIERLSFSDGTHVALDVSQWQDSAGAALALCYAGFGAIPDAQTLGHWIYAADNVSTSSSSKSSSGSSSVDPQARMEQVAQSMFDYYLPNGIDNATLVQAVFANVVGRAPDQTEQHTFTALLDQGVYSQTGLFAVAAENSLNSDHYIGLVGSGVVYTPYSASKAG